MYLEYTSGDGARILSGIQGVGSVVPTEPNFTGLPLRWSRATLCCVLLRPSGEMAVEQTTRHAVSAILQPVNVAQRILRT